MGLHQFLVAEDSFGGVLVAVAVVLLVFFPLLPNPLLVISLCILMVIIIRVLLRVPNLPLSPLVSPAIIVVDLGMCPVCVLLQGMLLFGLLPVPLLTLLPPPPLPLNYGSWIVAQRTISSLGLMTLLSRSRRGHLR
ncbi:hypothetical protein Tsubulata_025187 [Turnera subulata]|uniref:Uncharacterized protein n=1 Tax=Turnera subulata TaxID=218843 RepID=A0A9Q0FI99_9ROSI|nr:hypothetical protein Tsubulata_025187 [Turnera subulata]